MRKLNNQIITKQKKNQIEVEKPRKTNIRILHFTFQTKNLCAVVELKELHSIILGIATVDCGIAIVKHGRH